MVWYFHAHQDCTVMAHNKTNQPYEKRRPHEPVEIIDDRYRPPGLLSMRLVKHKL